MVENSTQLRVTQTQIKAFQMSIAANIRVGPGNIAPIIFIAMLQGFQSQIDEMEQDIENYWNQKIIEAGLDLWLK